MAQYRVLQANNLRVTLEDAAGRRHVTRPLQDVPGLGAELHGPHAAFGFAILSHVASRRLCRVIFEEINCSRAEARFGPPQQ